jgi:hypothetical protein
MAIKTSDSAIAVMGRSPGLQPCPLETALKSWSTGLSNYGWRDALRRVRFADAATTNVALQALILSFSLTSLISSLVAIRAGIRASDGFEALHPIHEGHVDIHKRDGTGREAARRFIPIPGWPERGPDRHAPLQRSWPDRRHIPSSAGPGHSSALRRWPIPPHWPPTAGRSCPFPQWPC